jgi:Phosphotransferase system, mannose/fructose-specific component IIA
MFQILIVSHGGLACEMLKTAEMIAGPQPDTATLGLFPGDSPEQLQQAIEAILQRWGKQDVLVLTDMRSGTPFNVVGGLMKEYDFRHISGINLAMLIEVLMARDDMSLNEAADEVLSLSSRTVLDVNSLLKDKN